MEKTFIEACRQPPEDPPPKSPKKVGTEQGKKDERIHPPEKSHLSHQRPPEDASATIIAKAEEAQRRRVADRQALAGASLSDTARE